VALTSFVYAPRRPADGVLYRIVQTHYETFRAEAASLRDGEGLPRFVDQEFRDFLRCGWHAGGFARLHCTRCGLDQLVAFSCKGRGFCPSCGGRRMAERAAHLVDHVFPDVPIRQWVLSLPHRLRYRLAWDHDLCRAVVGVLLRAVLGWLRHRGAARGMHAGRGGAVAVIQRFGGALNLNLHIHALVLDGVFAADAAGALRFHPAPPLTRLDVEEVLATVESRVARLLERRGLLDDDSTAAHDGWADDTPLLAGLAAASVEGRVVAGRAVQRLGVQSEGAGDVAPIGCHARAEGFDLHAGVVVPAGQRDRLERVCQYVLRPPVGCDRLTLTPDGQVRLELRHPWADGTTHLVFDPVSFLGRLAVLVPRPRVNLVLYHGVLAPRSSWRALIVPGGTTEAPAVGATRPNPRGYRWAELMRRTFAVDVLACPRCGERLRLIAFIEQADVIRRMLRHLGLPTEVPTATSPRAPPPDLSALRERAWEDDVPALIRPD